MQIIKISGLTINQSLAHRRDVIKVQFCLLFLHARILSKSGAYEMFTAFKLFYMQIYCYQKFYLLLFIAYIITIGRKLTIKKVK